LKLPRDVSGRGLANTMSRLGYRITRETGGHIRLSTERDGEHHLTIPDHDYIRVGTLSAIVRDLSEHHNLTRQEILDELFS
jgi:predicted RNA binding protein YcfA (HicA-like mRNA interferase family)